MIGRTEDGGAVVVLSGAWAQRVAAALEELDGLLSLEGVRSNGPEGRQAEDGAERKRAAVKVKRPAAKKDYPCEVKRRAEMAQKRKKKCLACGAEFVDETRTNKRKWCDSCPEGKRRDSVTSAPGMNKEQRLEELRRIGRRLGEREE